MTGADDDDEMTIERRMVRNPNGSFHYIDFVTWRRAFKGSAEGVHANTWEELFGSFLQPATRTISLPEGLSVDAFNEAVRALHRWQFDDDEADNVKLLLELHRIFTDQKTR